MSDLTIRNASAVSLDVVPMSDGLRNLVMANISALPREPREGRQGGFEGQGRGSRMLIPLSTLSGVSGAVVREARAAVPMMEALMAPAEPEVLSAGVKRMVMTLAVTVRDTPDQATRERRERTFRSVFADMPAQLWDTKFDRFIATKFTWWPAPSELLAVMNDYLAGDREKLAAMKIIAAREIPEAERPRVKTDEEREAVRLQMVEYHAEVAERRRHEVAVRKWGQWMPQGAEGLTGLELVAALEKEVPGMSGDQLAVTLERIEAIKKATEMAAHFM